MLEEPIASTEELPDPDAGGASVAGGYEFDGAFQERIAALTLRDSTFASRTSDFIKVEYLQDDADKLVTEMGLEFYRRYKKAPDDKIIGAVAKDYLDKKKLDPARKKAFVAKLLKVRKVDISDRDYVADKVATFAKHTAIGEAMTKAIGAWTAKDYGLVQKLMSASFLVGEITQGASYDYWAEIANRTKYREDVAAGRIVPNGVTSGHGELDSYLLPHRGWGRKELSILLAPAKGGKSMGLGEFGKNASLAGHNVIYFTLEVASGIIADRVDANVARTAMKILGKSAGDVDALVRRAHAGAGRLIFEEYASGSLKPSQIRRRLDWWRSQGVKFDLIIVDYADLMAAEYRADDLRENLRNIYIDLRALAFEEDAAVLTATQTNRDGAKAAVAKPTDVSEDWSKAMTCDVMISISATDDEKAKGEARLFFGLMRNAESGFTLRIEQDRSCMAFIKKIVGRE